MSAAILRFAKLSQNAYAPTKGSKHAAGYDLYRYDFSLPDNIQLTYHNGGLVPMTMRFHPWGR